MPVLQYFSHADAARRFQKRLQLVQRLFRRGLLGREAVGVQADQNCPVDDDLFFFHICFSDALLRRVGL